MLGYLRDDRASGGEVAPEGCFARPHRSAAFRHSCMNAFLDRFFGQPAITKRLQPIPVQPACNKAATCASVTGVPTTLCDQR